MSGYMPCMDRISPRRDPDVRTIEPALRPVQGVKQKATVDPSLQLWLQDQVLEDEVNTHNLLIPIVLGTSLVFWIGFMFLVF